MVYKRRIKVFVVEMNHLIEGDVTFLTASDWIGVHEHSLISIELYCNCLYHCTMQLIYAKQSQGEFPDHNMIMIITWLWHYNPTDSSTMIQTISWPLAIKFACMLVDLLLGFVHKFAHLLPFSTFLLLVVTLRTNLWRPIHRLIHRIIISPLTSHMISQLQFWTRFPT